MKMSEAILLVATLDWRVPDEMDKELFQGLPHGNCLVSEDEDRMYLLIPDSGIGNNACLQISYNNDEGQFEVETVWLSPVYTDQEGNIGHTVAYDKVSPENNPRTVIFNR